MKLWAFQKRPQNIFSSYILRDRALLIFLRNFMFCNFSRDLKKKVTGSTGKMKAALPQFEYLNKKDFLANCFFYKNKKSTLSHRFRGPKFPICSHNKIILNSS